MTFRFFLSFSGYCFNCIKTRLKLPGKRKRKEGDTDFLIIDPPFYFLNLLLIGYEGFEIDGLVNFSEKVFVFFTLLF